MPDPKGTVADTEADPVIDTRLVRKLAGILTATGLTEIEVEKGGLRIRVARQAGQTVSVGPAPAYQAAPQAAAPAPGAVEAPAAAPVKGDPVKSPMVGTTYLSPQPGAEPFVRIGDKVSAGQTILIVEAMKTMNPISSPRAGTVLAILVTDGQPVEFGEPLLLLE